MNTTYTTYPQKPTLVNVIAWTTLASGVVNIGWGIVASATAMLTIVGICCTPLTILPTILGIFEIIYAAKLLATPPQVVRPATNLAVLEIVCILTGNVFSMIVGIISLIFYNDPAVKDFFARLNGDLPSAPVPTGPQVPPVVPLTPAPTQEPIPSPITGDENVAPFEEPMAEQPTPPAEEIPLSEPPVEPENPVPPASSGQTIISSVRTDGMPEPPLPPEEPDTSGEKTGE